MGTIRINNEVMRLKDADGMANSADADQTPYEQSDRVYTVCENISVLICRIIKECLIDALTNSFRL